MYKCACGNIQVVAKLLRESLASNAQQTNEGLNLSKLLPSPNLHVQQLCSTMYMYNVHVHVIYNVHVVTSCTISECLKVFDQIIISNFII